MNYMRDGGITMWILLVAAIGTAIFAATRPRSERPGILLGGTVASLLLGLLGVSLGLLAVSKHYAQFPDKVAAIGLGLGELSNNGTFAVLLAALLGIASIVTRRRLAS
ncbi:MAG: hypothetical protein HYY06_33270 [Deltaproteobacteria bacterium]|nr:hypothetical protein [Deltaproteobacteria bacterium]